MVKDSIKIISWQDFLPLMQKKKTKHSWNEFVKDNLLNAYISVVMISVTRNQFFFL